MVPLQPLQLVLIGPQPYTGAHIGLPECAALMAVTPDIRMTAIDHLGAFRVSVVVPTYNRDRLLRYTLTSLAAQSLPLSDFEVIVIDDGSSDDSFACVKAFESRLSIKYVYQPDDGYRVARARNLGISLVESAITVFVDSGVMLAPDTVERHAVQHEQGDQSMAIIGYLYGYTRTSDGHDALAALIQTDDIAASIDALQNNGRFSDIREEGYGQHQDALNRIPAPWLYFWTSNVSVPTALLIDVGGFDEAYTSWGVEDLDLGLRLFKRGAEFRLDRQATAVHYPHPPNQMITDDRDNTVRFAQKFSEPAVQMLLNTRGTEINALLMKAQNDQSSEC